MKNRFEPDKAAEWIESQKENRQPDGAGYVSDEYGAKVYYFNFGKEIVGVITRIFRRASGTAEKSIFGLIPSGKTA